MKVEAATEDGVDSLLAEAICGLSSCADGDDGHAWLAEGSVVAGRYHIDRLLGEGGMGMVFAGTHVVTGKRVALKVLRGDPVRRRDAALRMTREARAAGRIHHPNVVDVYDAGIVDGRPFLVMELLEGESLEQRIARAPLTVEQAIDVMLQVLRGVAAVHAHGIIHRDLKPANIFLARDVIGGGETPKVLDFGISKSEREDDLLVTQHGVQVGTPMFMPPEQVRGDALHERADVYALSITLHYMLTQRYPFQARGRSELFAKILTGPPKPLSDERNDLPPGLSSLVLRGLEGDRTRRFVNVAEFERALAALRVRQPRARVITAAQRWWERSGRRARWAALALLSLTAVWTAWGRPHRAALRTDEHERSVSVPSSHASQPVSASEAQPARLLEAPPSRVSGSLADAPVEPVPTTAPRRKRKGVRSAQPVQPPVPVEKFMSW